MSGIYTQVQNDKQRQRYELFVYLLFVYISLNWFFNINYFVKACIILPTYFSLSDDHGFQANKTNKFLLLDKQ